MPSDRVESEDRQPDWFGAYAPVEHVRDTKGGIAYSQTKLVEDVAAGGTNGGNVVVDADTVAGDTVRLVYDKEDIEKLHDLLGELLEGDFDEQ